LSALIESLDNEQDNDSVASIDVNRVGFTPRTSMALTDTEDEHSYGYAEDPYARVPATADDSMDERDVEAMLLAGQEQADRSMQYADDEQYADEDLELEEDYAFIQPSQDWDHVLTVEDIRTRRKKPLSTIAEVRSSVGSRSQMSQFSPGAGSVGSIPPVPPIPSMYRPRAEEDPQYSSLALGLGPSPPSSLRSHHSRAGTDPGPQTQPRSASPVKPISATSFSLGPGVRERIAMFERERERGASPSPASGLGLIHGARPGSPGTQVGLGLGLSLTRSPAPGSMLSTPFSPAQSMPPMSPSASSGNGARFDEPRSVSYHSSQSSTSRSRQASPVPSIKSYQSSEGECYVFECSLAITDGYT